MSQPDLPAKDQSASASGSRFRSLWLPALICFLLLLGEGYVLLHDLGGGRASQSGKTKPVATFESGKNEVRQKNGGTILWQPPAPGQILYQQDSLATMTNAEATVRFADQSELVIEPDSLIVFEEASFPKDGGQAKIVARLIRGSIQRKNTGPSNLLIKLPGEAQPVELSDTHGGAVFRVVYRSNGIEVIVESGGVRMNGKEVKPAPPSKLPSPSLKKPEIEIRKVDQHASLWDHLTDWIIPSAFAADRWQISIHFGWEPVPGADAYRIQIARDPDFHTVILDTSVKATTYDYQSDLPAQPQTLYMRVAAQDASGAVGDFSPLEKIQIQSVSEISREYVDATPSPTPSPKPAHHQPHKKTQIVHRPKPAPAPKPTPVPKERRPNRIEVSYGVVYQSRSFKGGDLPTSVSSSGFVPALLSAEYVSERYRFGGSYLFEVANSGSSGDALQNGKLGVPVVRAWFLFEKPGFFDGWSAGLGPYLTSSTQFSWSGSVLDAQTQLLGGALLDATKETKLVRWRAELGIVGPGSTGVDASVTARKWLFSEHRFFGELGGQLRLMSLESSYGGTLAFGISF